MPRLRLHADTLRSKAKSAGDETDYAIARRLGLEQSTISRLLTGRTTPSLATLVAMRTAYDVSLDELVPAVDRKPAMVGATAP